MIELIWGLGMIGWLLLPPLLFVVWLPKWLAKVDGGRVVLTAVLITTTFIMTSTEINLIHSHHVNIRRERSHALNVTQYQCNPSCSTYKAYEISLYPPFEPNGYSHQTASLWKLAYASVVALGSGRMYWKRTAVLPL